MSDHLDPKKSVYVIGTAHSTRCKIGYSKNIRERLTALQSGCPDELYVLLQLRGDSSLETALHRHLADRRLHSEWFELGPDPVRTAIDAVRAVQGWATDAITIPDPTPVRWLGAYTGISHPSATKVFQGIGITLNPDPDPATGEDYVPATVARQAVDLWDQQRLERLNNWTSWAGTA